MRLTLDQQTTPFDLESTLQCGQLFRWKKEGGWWYGVVEGKVVKARQNGRNLEVEGVERRFIDHYFRLEDNLPEIISRIRQDPWIAKATETFPGLRVVRQDPWECLASYICATYKNIPGIKQMIHLLSRRFGEEIIFEDCTYHGFPTPAALANSSLYQLRSCKLGYRAKRVRAAARIVHRHQLEFEELQEADYETARVILLEIPGVGNKVADCILLFSLDKLEAFPIDRWITRVIQDHYSSYFDASFFEKISTGRSLSANTYSTMSTFARAYFGRFAGYAQEYLYHFARVRARSSSQRE